MNIYVYQVYGKYGYYETGLIRANTKEEAQEKYSNALIRSIDELDFEDDIVELYSS